MGMTGIHRGIESSQVELSRIEDNFARYTYINSSFPFFVLLIFSRGFSCGIFSPSTILILILGEAIFAQLIYSNYNKILLRDCKYSCKEIGISLAILPLCPLPPPIHSSWKTSVTQPAGYHWRACIERTLTPFADVGRNTSANLDPVSLLPSPFRPWNPHAFRRVSDVAFNRKKRL